MCYVTDCPAFGLRTWCTPYYGYHLKINAVYKSKDSQYRHYIQDPRGSAAEALRCGGPPLRLRRALT